MRVGEIRVKQIRVNQGPGVGLTGGCPTIFVTYFPDESWCEVSATDSW